MQRISSTATRSNWSLRSVVLGTVALASCFWAHASEIDAPTTPPNASLLWKNSIVPLFDRECVKCHGALKQKGGLDLSRFQAALQGGDSGTVIVPGKAKASLLFQHLQPGADPHMPPKRQLKAEELNLIETWIDHLAIRSSEAAPVAEEATETTPIRVPEHLAPAQVIDSFIEQEWQRRKLAPAPLCDDRTFIRRVYLDLTGTLPSRDAVRAFLFDSRMEKRSRLVTELLATEAYARNMAETFDLLLLGRKDERALSRREQNGWFEFLQSTFLENLPWNQTVQDIIVARRSPDESETAPQKGSLWFLYEQRNNHQAMAEAIAPFVFGTQIKCAQCHDHPLAHEIKQAHYWGTVAAFNRSQNVTTSEGIGISESAIGGFINFANLQQESQPARLVFLNGKQVDEKRPAPGEEETDGSDLYLVPPPEKDQPATAAIPKFSRRQSFAQAVTQDNPLLAKAFVNHLWALFLGRGIVHPVDEINSKYPPSHPDLLQWLADDFSTSNFDVKRLIEIILGSRVYQLAISDNPIHQQHRDAYPSAREKPLKAETLYRMFLVLTHGDEASYREAYPEQAKTMLTAFRKQYPDLLPATIQATLQQAMFLSNSPELDHLLDPREGNLTAELLSITPLPKRIEETFVSILGRLPDKTELDHLSQFFEQRLDRPEAAQKQLMWSLLTSPEFQYNH